ncbi:transposable element Tcb1 transposase [Trichonephila clavipes]|nr:transposable element Tcb1 transposase [Trichonephila clavipes]
MATSTNKTAAFGVKLIHKFNGDRYRVIITNFFIPELNNQDVQELWFQQDSATCHTARATIDLLKDTFGDRLISRFGPVNWPPRSCDLTPLDYFLWGYVKSLVYADKPQTLDHLEDNIRRVIADIRPQMFEKVIENWMSRFDYIRSSRGSHMPEIIFKISHLCGQKIIGRFKSDGLVENESGRGRKSILSDVDKRKVLKDIKIDPKLSAVKLAAETSRVMGRSVSAETVINVIRHAGYSSRVARKKLFISLQNQKKRLEFAKTYQLKTDNFWKKVIFSDESKFNIFGSDGHRTVWRKPNTALDPKNLRPTIKHGGGSVMVWGCMASNVVENLVFIDGIMDHKLYIDILNNNLKESAKKLGLDGNFIFQLDNDPKHTARNVKMWCLFHCKQQLHTPPQSPDINVIENLWATLKTAVQKHQIRNKAHLKQVLQEEWDKISPDTTKKLVESVPRRLEDIIKAKGHATKY